MHRRAYEPHAQIMEPSHYDGLLRRVEAFQEDHASGDSDAEDGLEVMGRSLAYYASIVEAQHG